MFKEQVKEEFKKRYIYAQKNASAILASSVLNEDDLIRKYPNSEWGEKNGYYITLSLEDETLQLIESLLLEDGSLENTSGYAYFEYLKNTEGFDKFIKQQEAKIENFNKHMPTACLYKKLSAFTVLAKLYSYVKEQSGDLENKEKKLHTIDEYIRVSRFKNDGKVWTSGYNHTLHDIFQLDNYSAIAPLNKKDPSREPADIGIVNNGYINYIANHFMLLSEKEKQDIYLMFHTEEPTKNKIKSLLPK